MFALCSSKQLALTGIVAGGLVLATATAMAQDDPPSEAGRISYISGNVSIQPITADEWGQAYPNLPVGPGDRIFTDSDGRAEIQVGQTYVRIGPNSDVTLVDDSSFNINFGIAQGSIRLHSFGLWPRQLLDISTPNGNAEFANSGDLRVDVLPNDGATVFTNLGQFADITAAGDFRQELDNGQSLELAGSNPVSPQWLQPNGPDDLDNWSQERDQQLARAATFQYVSPEIPGAADLDASGDWQPQTEYGAVWFPRGVSADWEPYHNGHWINRDPWGWVWVEDESWGYAPFHYGRWVRYHDRWGWVPGPVNVRPVWSPALVVFAGGVGGGGGVGLSVWFPLGPGEAYRPWYRCSPRYVDQVNITNIREAPRVHVERTYVNVVNVTNITYVNKTYVTAVRQDDFAHGRSVRNVAVRVDPREVQQVRPLAQPIVAPPARAIVTRPVAHPVPVSIQRPVLINQQGKQISAKPGAIPVAPPVRPNPPVRPIPGRTVVAAPTHPVQNGPGRNPIPPAQGNQQRPNQPYVPNPGSVPRANPVGPVRGIQQPNQPNYQQPNQPNQPNGQPQRPNQPTSEQPNQPNRPTYQQPQRPNQPQPNQPANQPRPNQPYVPNPGSVPRANPVPPVPGEPRPNQPNQPNQPNNQPQRPNQPNPEQPNQPNRPNYQQPNRSNEPQPNQPANQPRPNQPYVPNPGSVPRANPVGPVQGVPRPNQPNQPNNQPQRPNQPNYQQPNQPNRPNNQPSRPEERQAPPPTPQGRPLPPTPQNRSAEQQQNRPNNNNNKDQKKNDKKDQKKDDKKQD
ncbi:MAG TPA: DUF6600 domain-containing protein [Terracidiphilus sp.]|jgi:hypothetical protein